MRDDGWIAANGEVVSMRTTDEKSLHHDGAPENGLLVTLPPIVLLAAVLSHEINTDQRVSTVLAETLKSDDGGA